MSREVVTQRDIIKYNEAAGMSKDTLSATIPAGKDKYADRLFKYIPAELVAGYVFTAGVLNQLSDTGEIRIFHWGVFLVFCILTPLYLWRIQKVTKIQQHLISLLSFMVWVFALGGPFMFCGWYKPVLGEILLPVFTIAAAIWEAEW